MTDLFTVCKIEAGRAVLLSQKDFEIIEFPAKLLPNGWEKGPIKINATCNENERNMSEERSQELLREIERDFVIENERIEEIKREISNCLRIENLGCTAAILNWNRSISEVFGPNIRIDNIILDIEAGSDDCGYVEEFIDFVRRGQKSISIHDTRCRVNLPIDLRAKLIVKTSVGYFKSNSVDLKMTKFEGFSGIFVLTDLTGPEETVNLLEFLREQGGYISRTFSPDQPITAVVTDSFASDLFKLGIENNLPVVSGTWLEALVATRELPQFEDHLIKN